MHARGSTWGHLIFQDLLKKEQQSIYNRVIWRELVARANSFEQRATEYLKATKSKGGAGVTAYGRRSKSREMPDRAADLRVA